MALASALAAPLARVVASSASVALAPRAAVALGAGACPSRSFYVKVSRNASRDLERLQAKVTASGLERLLTSRKRFVKPCLERQKAARDSVYNRAKRERARLVEEMMLDKTKCPF